MSRAQPLTAPAGLLPLPRPLMTGEVLDASFRLFRAGLLSTLPYSGLTVLVLEFPTLYSTFLAPASGLTLSTPDLRAIAYGIALVLIAALLGVMTLRLHAISRGIRPGFRREALLVLRRWPNGVIAMLGALGIPLALFGLGPVFTRVLPTEALIVAALPLLWPMALLAVALPAFWCDGLGPFAAILRAVRVSRRKTWRMVGAILATGCMVAVFYVLAAIVVAVMSPMLGRADLFLIATVSSMLSLVIGAIGVPFVLSVLIVAYEDLKLRSGVVS